MRASTTIDAPAHRVWELLSRFEHWPEWGTTVRSVTSDSPVVAAGVAGRVKTVAGPWLPFVITDVESGRAWDWEVAGIPATRHIVEPVEPGGARAIFTVAWPAAPYLLAIYPALRRLKRLAEQP